MDTNNEPINYFDKSGVTELPDGTPKTRLTTPWFRTDLGCFRVDISVIGPKAQEPKDYFTLTAGEAANYLKEIANMVKILKDKLRG